MIVNELDDSGSRHPLSPRHGSGLLLEAMHDRVPRVYFNLLALSLTSDRPGIEKIASDVAKCFIFSTKTTGLHPGPMSDVEACVLLFVDGGLWT